MKNIIIRKSKNYPSLLLVSNSEKVYRIYFMGEELFNSLDYDTISNYFTKLEMEDLIYG